MKAALDLERIAQFQEKQAKLLFGAPPMQLARGGTYRANVERVTTMSCDRPRLGVSDDGLTFSYLLDSTETYAGYIEERVATVTLKGDQRKLSDHHSRLIAVPRAKKTSSLATAARDLTTALGPPLAALAGALAALWALLVAWAVSGYTKYCTWRDAPLTAELARKEELAQIRAGANEQAAYADQNGMPESAEVWRRIALEAAA